MELLREAWLYWADFRLKTGLKKAYPHSVLEEMFFRAYKLAQAEEL